MWGTNRDFTCSSASVQVEFHPYKIDFLCFIPDVLFPYHALAATYTCFYSVCTVLYDRKCLIVLATTEQRR